jgi:hypothetical protein
MRRLAADALLAAFAAAGCFVHVRADAEPRCGTFTTDC